MMMSMLLYRKGTSSDVIVSKLDQQTIVSVFDSHWVTHNYGLVPHLSSAITTIRNEASVSS